MTQSAKTVLLIEDEQSDSQQIRLAFEMAQVWPRVAVARGGQEAMEYLRRFGKYRDLTRYPNPSVIIIDLTLPPMDGLQFLAWLQSSPEFQRVPKVVLTGSRQEEDRKLAMELGCNEYFVKPRGLLELVGVVQRISVSWLDQRRAPHDAKAGHIPLAEPSDSDPATENVLARLLR
jgi:CheY-like chemotaxis protein